MEVHVSSDGWTQTADTWISGSAFFGDEYVSEEELADRIAAIDSRRKLKRLLSKANGFFSVLHDTGDRIYAAADHVRSEPIYYASTDDVYVSDSAEWVHENGARRGYDPVAGTEYLFTGFVSGKDTLSRDVKQVRAGELMMFSSDRSSPNVRGERYFSYDPTGNSSTTHEDNLDEALVEAISRLMEYADGRTILLGLSGGYDSRLIALMLHRLGYDNTITFTTHAAAGGSEEVSVAESIARDLDFEHIEITTDRSDYQNINDSEQMDLITDVGYLSEYPSINKVVQRRKLKEAGIDPGDVILVLGHTWASAGEFLPEWVRDRTSLRRDEFLEFMWTLHYSHWETPSESRWRELFEGRILKRTPVDLYRTGNVESTLDAVGGFETWYWQERLPKYVVIRRVYEYLGFDVWYPLLDRTLGSFFGGSDHRDRIDRRMWKEYVRQLDVRIRGEKSDLAAESDSLVRSMSGVAWDRAVQLVHMFPDPATQFVRRMYNEYKSRDVYEQDPRYRIVPKDEFDSISFPKVYARELHRPLLLLYLYKNGYFDFPVETEFDRALES